MKPTKNIISVSTYCAENNVQVKGMLCFDVPSKRVEDLWITAPVFTDAVQQIFSRDSCNEVVTQFSP